MEQNQGLYMIQGVSTETQLASIKEFILANQKTLLVVGGVIAALLIINQSSK